MLINTRVDTDTIAVGDTGSSNRIRIMILTSRLATQNVAGFKTWLANNNVKVSVALNSPIEEEIIDPEAVNSLNAIKSIAESYYGTTNIMITSDNLAPYIKVQTLNKIGG